MVGGTAVLVPGTNEFALARFDDHGAPISTFGQSGLVTTDFIHGVNVADAALAQIQVDAQGRLVVLGTDYYSLHDNPENDLVIVRFDPTTGQVDTSLNPSQSGRLYFSTQAGYEGATSLAIQPDGKWLVAGFSSFGSYAPTNFIIRRLSPVDGSLDPTFGEGGLATLDFSDMSGTDDGASTVLAQADGNIVVAGFSAAPGAANGNGALARYNQDGSLDGTFGIGGRLLLPSLTSVTSAVEMADGSILVAGGDSSGKDFVVEKLRSDGTPDSTFGQAGISKFGFGSDQVSAASALALQIVNQQTDIIIAGSTAADASSAYSFAVARLTPAGALDATFNGTGEEIIPFGSHSAIAASALVDHLNRIVLAGSVRETAFNFALARLDANGGLDATFGSAGEVVGVSGRALSVVEQSDGHLVVGGNATIAKSQTNANAFLLAQYNADGTLATGFGGQNGDAAGTVSTDFTCLMTMTASTQSTDLRLIRVTTSWLWGTAIPPRATVLRWHATMA